MTKEEKIDFLVRLATKFDKLGLHSLASDVDRVLEAETSNIEAILSIYKDLHRIASVDSEEADKQIIATLRKDDRPDTPRCPFGLPIPRACKYVGDLVLEMDPRKVEHRYNRRLYNAQRKHCVCPYALQILEKGQAVHCSFNTMNATIPHWEQYRASPYYPKMWQGFNIPEIVLDRNYYTYNDYNYYSVY